MPQYPSLQSVSLTNNDICNTYIGKRLTEYKLQMLGITLRNKICNSKIRHFEPSVGIIELNWSCAGHPARRGNDHWSKASTDWWPRAETRVIQNRTGSMTKLKRAKEGLYPELDDTGLT